MRSFLTGLMICLVIAGLNVRVIAAIDHWQSAENSHVCEDHDHGHHHHSDHPEPEPCDEDCPPEPHHHHECRCSQPMPLTLENVRICRVACLEFSLLGVKPEHEIAPDEPFLQLEKPPLI